MRLKDVDEAEIQRLEEEARKAIKNDNGWEIVFVRRVIFINVDRIGPFAKRRRMFARKRRMRIKFHYIKRKQFL